ncbi:MAG: hypothetical protein ACLPN6_09550 [Streptosporangiaceae bacterium]|jgi:hypothetical protein
MRTSLKTRLASLAAAAAIATTGAMSVAGAADAATVHHRLHTNLSIGASKIDHQQGAIILGVLSSHRTALAGKRVWLDRKLKGGKWVLLRSQLTNRHGLVRFAVLPPATAAFKLVFRGTVNFAPSQSLAIVVHRKA